MEKILIEEKKGIISQIFLPNVYRKYGFIDEEEVDKIALRVETNIESLVVIKDREKYADYFVKDKVILSKYILILPYEEYLKKVKEEVETYYSNKTEEERESIYQKYACTQKEFLENPRKIMQYELRKEVPVIDLLEEAEKEVFDSYIKGIDI